MNGDGSKEIKSEDFIRNAERAYQAMDQIWTVFCLMMPVLKNDGQPIIEVFSKLIGTNSAIMTKNQFQEAVNGFMEKSKNQDLEIKGPIPRLDDK